MSFFSHKVYYVHMNLEEFYQATTQLFPVKMDAKLPQYFIQSWQLNYMKSGKYSISSIVRNRKYSKIN